MYYNRCILLEIKQNAYERRENVMTFLEAYKKLDNVCKEMYSGDKGVSAYIDDMEHVPNAGYKIQEWNSVYQKLKHYRYIRNQIVHENYATEDNMCNESDVHGLIFLSAKS
jgi:hypothetical protein